MAQNLIDLRRRIRAVKDTQKTTKAMKTVSASKLRRSVTEWNRTQPLMERIRETLDRVVKFSEITETIKTHPFLEERTAGETVMVVVSTDKGLCGAFNSHLVEMVEHRYRELLQQGNDRLTLVTIGNKAYKHFKKRDYPIKKTYPSVMTRLRYQHAMDLSVYLQEIYLNPKEEIKRIEFVFTEYRSASKQERAVRSLFPIPLTWEKPGAGEGKDAGESGHGNPREDIEYIFEPSAEEIFKALLPKYIDLLVYQVLLQSSASEQTARMVAMEQATQNADDMIRRLTLTMNKVRQASITKELLEIITATEALRK